MYYRWIPYVSPWLEKFGDDPPMPIHEIKAEAARRGIKVPDITGTVQPVPHVVGPDGKPLLVMGN